MDKTTYQNIAQHVKILGWLHIATSILTLLGGAVAFFFIMLGGLLSGDADAAAITTIVAFAIGGFLLVVSLPGLIAGWGLLKRKSWARLLALVIGFLSLLNFPLGTAVGVYTLWILLQDEASTYFAQPKTV